MDEDGDGHLSYNEFKNFFETTGLTIEPFLHMYNDVAHHTEVNPRALLAQIEHGMDIDQAMHGQHREDGVDIYDIMEHINRLMAVVQTGYYHAHESIMEKDHLLEIHA